MKLFSKTQKKTEKGQVLVLVGLMMISLVAVIGLAIDTGYLYVSYARLQRAVDAAALAATGEFKRPKAPDTVTTRDAKIAAAAKQMFALNGINLDSSAGFTDPMSSTVGMSIQTCDNTSGDAVLCKTPLQKIIRITAQERVPLFFLSVIGFTNVPIKISTVATAASADVILTLDTSSSMAEDVSANDPMRDPAQCNALKACLPMEDVKTAAKLFLDEMYFPYDRVGIVSFDHSAVIQLPLSDNEALIETTIDDLTVYEGEDFKLTSGWTGSQCIYFDDDSRINWENIFDPSNASPPEPSPPNTDSYDTSSGGNYDGPCRLYRSVGASFADQFSCPRYFGTYADPSYCGQTNLAGGINRATRSLLGDYSEYSGPAPIPLIREDSIWILMILSDFVANIGFSASNSVICPASTFANARPCVDRNASVTHSSGSADYDVDDLARDEFVFADNNNIVIYTIGLGQAVFSTADQLGPPPGQTLMEYPNKTLDSGQFFFSPTGSDLGPIFLTIANLITSRINQ